MLARKSTLIISTRVANALLGYVAIYFITRFMSPEAYGIMAFAYSFVNIFSIIANLGFDPSHIKKVSAGKDEGRCVGTYLTIKVLLVSLMTVAIFVFLWTWQNIIGKGFETPIHEMAVYIMIVYWVTRTLSTIPLTTFKAKKQIAKKQIASFLESTIRVTIIIYVALMGYGALALVYAYVISIFGQLASAVYFGRNLKISKPSFAVAKEYTVFAIPLVIATTSGLIIRNIDKVLIQLFWNADDVGYYFAAFRLTIFISLFTKAIGSLLFPTFSNLNTTKNIQKIKQLTHKVHRYISMFVSPMVFGIVCLAVPITRILLSDWQRATPVLQILPFFVLFNSLAMPYKNQLKGMNKPKLVRNQVILMLIANLTLNLILIPSDIKSLGVKLFGLGTRGAALATAASFFVGFLYAKSRGMQYKKHKLNRSMAKHFCASAIMAVILLAVIHYIYIGRWYQLLGLVLLGVSIYFSILFLLGEFKKQDLNLILDSLHIKKMIHYIKNEIKK